MHRLAYLALPAIVAAVAVAVYVPTLGAGWTSTDDTELIVEDAAFLSSDGSGLAAFSRPFFPQANRRSYYRPLVTASFAKDVTRGEPPSPAPFHLTNVAIHAATSVLVFFFARALGSSPLVSAAAALIFAVHPITTQAVAWIPGRCDGLLAAFALAALLAWIAFDKYGTRRYLLVHHAAFAAALFSKETAVVIPIVASLYSLIVTRAPRRMRNPWAWAGWISLAAIWALARRSAIGATDYGALGAGMLENSPALLMGIGKLVIPVEIDVLATVRDSSLIPGAFAAGVLALGAAFAVNDERRRPFVWAALIFPVIFLLPALGVADFLMLDNRAYLPLAGVAAGLAVVAEPWWVLSRRARVVSAAVWGGDAPLARDFSCLHAARAFESPRQFCEAAVRGSPHLGLAHVNLGSVEYRDGNLDGARREFERALSVNPNEPIAHNNLGLVYMNSGNLGRAETEYGLELGSNPNYSKAHYNLGLVLAGTGREELAREHFERAVALMPSDTEALGELLKYWAPRDASRADTIMKRMESLGVKFYSP